MTGTEETLTPVGDGPATSGPETADAEAGGRSDGFQVRLANFSGQIGRAHV